VLQVILLLTFLQETPAHHTPDVTGNPFEYQQMLAEAKDREFKEFQKRQSTYEQQEFTRKFNNLVHAMAKFSETYNTKHVIDVKMMKTLRAAIKDFEKESWLKASYK
jgi:hypothetical protein